MKADTHFEVGGNLDADQSVLDPAKNWRLIVEGCYMAAHHYLLAGAEWRGVSHPQNHAHAANAGILRKAGAPAEVQNAWQHLDYDLRPGRVYGRQLNGTASAEARDALKLIKDWAAAARPSP
jgi:hypothetical protein